MVVSFTPNIGLAKPDNSELALNWTRATKLQEDNNLIIMDKTEIDLQSYTPVLNATTTPASIGAGAVRGEYQDFQGFIVGTFVIEFVDPGVSIGAGEYGISLPFVADNTYHTVATTFNQSPGVASCIGEGYIYDNSNASLSGPVALDVATVGGVSYARLVTGTFAAPVKTNRLYAAGMPSNVGTLDRWCGSFWYKRT